MRQTIKAAFAANKTRSCGETPNVIGGFYDNRKTQKRKNKREKGSGIQRTVRVVLSAFKHNLQL
jgi:hypothetical protein